MLATLAIDNVLSNDSICLLNVKRIFRMSAFCYLPARIPRGFAPGMNGGETNFSARIP